MELKLVKNYSKFEQDQENIDKYIKFDTLITSDEIIVSAENINVEKIIKLESLGVKKLIINFENWTEELNKIDENFLIKFNLNIETEVDKYFDLNNLWQTNNFKFLEKIKNENDEIKKLFILKIIMEKNLLDFELIDILSFYLKRNQVNFANLLTLVISYE